MSRRITGAWLGRRPYTEVHELQHRLFDARRAGTIGDTILFLEHDPVITLGRGTKPPHLLATSADLARRGVSVVSTGRGGDITLHAPGQLVAYPIFELSPDRCDVRRYVRDLNEVMRLLVADYGVAAGPFEKYVGLWVDAADPAGWRGAELAARPAKIGAIGVKISRWTTMHGFALNLTTELDWYELIVPCGISEYAVTSVSSLTGSRPETAVAAARAFVLFCEVFSAEPSAFMQCTDGLTLDVAHLLG
jgi:lipoyl(octanoyl) transferase